MKEKRVDSIGNELFCGEYERKDRRYAYHYRISGFSIGS